MTKIVASTGSTVFCHECFEELHLCSDAPELVRPEGVRFRRRLLTRASGLPPSWQWDDTQFCVAEGEVRRSFVCRERRRARLPHFMPCCVCTCTTTSQEIDCFISQTQKNVSCPLCSSRMSMAEQLRAVRNEMRNEVEQKLSAQRQEYGVLLQQQQGGGGGAKIGDERVSKAVSGRSKSMAAELKQVTMEQVCCGRCSRACIRICICTGALCSV